MITSLPGHNLLMNMKSLYAIGRVFYGIAIAGIGFQTIYYHEFPYMMIPPKHSWIPNLPMVAYIFGGLLMLTGASIFFEKKARPVSLFL